ncbi:MAG TPA: hypothetical protein VED37_12690, partial [Ktedonobacteraceae bacterium]|nr:hypothetical protein [Ktedonobacteraceae bacterium]
MFKYPAIQREGQQDSASALHTVPQTASVPNPAPIPTVEFPASNSSCNQANGDHSSATRGRNAWPPSVITL